MLLVVVDAEVCPKKQKQLAKEIKRARTMGMT